MLCKATKKKPYNSIIELNFGWIESNCVSLILPFFTITWKTHTKKEKKRKKREVEEVMTTSMNDNFC
jgi:hypothetical protein